MQSDNLTPFLAANGVKIVDKIGTYNDTNFTIGGPIKKDKVWFFGSGRFFIVNKPIANTYVSDGTQGRHRRRARTRWPAAAARSARRASIRSISTAAWRASPGRSARATSCPATTTASTRCAARR